MMNHSKQHQSGIATLFVCLIILFGVIGITGYGSLQAVVEQNTTASDRRIHEAFEAADAGIEKGITYLQANNSSVVVDADSDGFIDAYSNAAITNAALPAGNTFTVTYSNATPSNFDVVDVTSTGTSIDGTVSRTVHVTVVRRNPLTVAVSAGLVAKKEVTVSGDFTVTNTFNNPTIWSGGPASISGSASTNGKDGVSSDKNSMNSDVVQNDAAINNMSPSQFFDNFFNASADSVKNNADIYLSNPGSLNSLDGTVGKMIWVDQTTGTALLNSNVTLGSAEHPVVLIINGPFEIKGTAKIYGLVYTTGDWDNSGGGTAEIIGSAISGGKFSTTGTPNMTFDPNIITTIQNNLVAYSKLPGSWRDF